MELPFRFLEPPPPGRAKNPDFPRLETRSTKFPHYLFDFSLGPGPRTFLPIKKHFFFSGGVRKIRQKKNRPLREKCRKNTRCPLPFRLRRRPSVAPFRAGNAGPRGSLARPVGRHRENAPRSWKAFFPRHRVSKSVLISVTQIRRLLTIFCRKLIFRTTHFFARNRLFSPFSVLDHKGKTRFFRERNLPRGFSEPPPLFWAKKPKFWKFHFEK